MSEETATTTVKAWIENGKTLRAKLEQERARLLSKVAEIDEALAIVPGTATKRAVKAPNGDAATGTGKTRRGRGDVPSIRAAILAAVAVTPAGVDRTTLSIAARNQRTGVRTLRNSVINIANKMVQTGEIRSVGEGDDRAYFPATKANGHAAVAS